MKIAQYDVKLTRQYLRHLGLSRYQARRVYQKVPENSQARNCKGGENEIN